MHYFLPFDRCHIILPYYLLSIHIRCIVYRSHVEQKEAIEVFLKIDDMRKQLIFQLVDSQENLSPGGADARTQAD